MIFSVSIIHETKKRERYKTVYVEADTFGEAEDKASVEIDTNEDLEGFEITSISRESESRFLR